MNKFIFPDVSEEKPAMTIANTPIKKVQAVFLFYNATGESVCFAIKSFELSFPNKNEITLRDIMEWIRAYYKNKNNG